MALVQLGGLDPAKYLCKMQLQRLARQTFEEHDRSFINPLFGIFFKIEPSSKNLSP
jgi:hypothetical protein